MKHHPYRTIRQVILISMILLPLIPFALSLWIGHYYFTTSVESGTIATLQRIVQDHRLMIDSFLSERKNDLEFILSSYSYEEITRPERLAEIFDHLQKKSDAFVDLGIINEEGMHVAYRGPYELKGKKYAETEWFKNVLKEGYFISDIFLGYRQVPHFIIALAREDAGKRWIIRATIDTYLFNHMVEKVRIGKTGEAYILNSEGILQTDRRSGGNIMERIKDPLEYPETHQELKTFISQNEKGDRYLCATTWLTHKKWLLVIRQEHSDAFSAFRSASYLIILTVIIGTALIIAVAFMLTSRIIRMMQELDTEKEYLNQQLIRASRLAELGEMAAGFAHEINNPLQIMRSEQSLIEMLFSEIKQEFQLPWDTLVEIEDSMNQIKLQIDRCASITQSILKFGRQSEPVMQDLDLTKFIPEVIRMVEKKASINGIEIFQDFEDNVPMVHGDAGQLQQVMLNLCNNAIDAIVERHGSEGGRLSIYVGEKNGKAEIHVGDNGSGINPDNLKKIFSPFFTTKPVGKGTGLGLSVCYGIIDNMGGTIEVSSEKGVGTTFSIHLPIAKKKIH